MSRALFVLFCFAPGTAAAQVVINEIEYDMPGVDTAEYVELKNVSAADVDLDSYTLEFANGAAAGATYDTIDLPAVTLAAGGYYVVCGNAATVVNCNLDDGPNTDFIQNGAPDAIGLKKAGVLVDAVSYEGNTVGYTEGAGDTGDPAAVANAGISRAPDGSDTGDNQTDFALRCLTPGRTNSLVGVGCAPPTGCGDGVVNLGETCDDGIANGTTACGCQMAVCTYVTAGTSCGSATDDECTDPDSCDGAGLCADNDEAVGTACGDASDGDCTNPDACDGAGVCLANHESEGTACGSASDTECTNPDACDDAGSCLVNDEAVDAPCGDASDTECTDPDGCDGAGACLVHDALFGSPCGDGTGTDCSAPDGCDGAGSCLPNHMGEGEPCGDATDTTCTDPDACDGAGGCLVNDVSDGAGCDDDGVECTADECAGGACVHPALDAGTACGDAVDDDCTDPDICDGAGSCLPNHVVDGTACEDDGLFCTGESACAAGACEADTPPCDPETETCDEDADHCVACGDGIVDDGEDCDDGNEVDDDGCSGCAVDDGWTCDDGEPSVCAEKSGGDAGPCDADAGGCPDAGADGDGGIDGGGGDAGTDADGDVDGDGGGETSDEGGCGCRAAGAASAPAGIFVAALFAIAVGRRRRTP